MVKYRRSQQAEMPGGSKTFPSKYVCEKFVNSPNPWTSDGTKPVARRRVEVDWESLTRFQRVPADSPRTIRR